MLTSTTLPDVRQRAELTYRENVSHGRHGWLRLTPAYSVKVVDKVLVEFGGGVQRVFEPFSGSGTTALCAAYGGLDAVAIDINPFLVWVGRVKSSRYSRSEVTRLVATGRRIAGRVREDKAGRGSPPPLRNIERWWNPAELGFITRLRDQIGRVASGPVSDLLKIAFCRTLISLSNAAFNHQSMSFKDGRRTRRLPHSHADRFVAQFLSDVRTVADGAVDNPQGEARIECVDARSIPGFVDGLDAFDLLVTSPPYPNRMSYIRELRPYMYWLGFLDDAKQAGELDWEAIGGTWGIATSRLSGWTPTGAYVPRDLAPIMERIRTGHPKNGELMAKYIHKYFHDMFLHFLAASRLVRCGGTAHYIVGNAIFYGNLVPTERLFCDQLGKADFRRVEARVLRKRNSKKDLVEYHVIAQR